MNGLLAGVKPSPGWLCTCIDLDPTSPSVTWLVYGENQPPLSLVVMLRLKYLYRYRILWEPVHVTAWCSACVGGFTSPRLTFTAQSRGRRHKGRGRKTTLAVATWQRGRASHCHVQSKDSLVLWITVTWTCDQLDWFQSSSSAAATTPHISTPWERVSWLLFRLSFCLCLVRFSGYDSCFPTLIWASWIVLSLSSQKCSPWVHLHLCIPASCLAITRTIWCEWTRAWWSCELVLRLLVSDNKDQPPPPDHLLMWVDSIKVIPLGFVPYFPWVPSRIPQLIPATLIVPL